jgi:threonine dehydrogenase-like Zn-dependent dehydrogenase
MAQRLIAPIGNLHVVPEDISDRQAILVEPLAAAIRTFELTPLNPGDVVVVLGCGRLGKMIALVASKLDATVVAVGRSRAHLEQVSPYAEVRVAFGPDTSSHGDVICARSEDEL